MKTLKTVWAILLFSAVMQADVIVMKNGDRVTGAIVKKDGNNLTVASTLFGTITLPWDQVDSVKTDTPINVVLADGKTAQANLSTANGKLDVSGQSVAPADVKVLRNAVEQKAYERLLHPRLTQLWAGTGTLAWAGTAGNSKTNTFAIGVNAARATNTDKTTVYFNTVKASSQANGITSDTAQAVRGGLGYSRNFSKKMFFNGFNDWEYDKFQSLDLRFVLGGGVGYHVWKNDKSFLDLLGGLDYKHDKFDPSPLPKYSKSAAEIYLGDDYGLKLNARTSFNQSFRYFANLSDTSGYRVNFDMGANTQLFKWLSWNLSFSDRYLNTPAPGRKKNDLLYTTGFGINFAH
jgi:putative salt-induced outer membrane protein YdiY